VSEQRIHFCRILEVELVRRDFDFEGFLRDSEEFLPRGIRFKSFFFLDNPKDSAAKLVKSVTYRIKPFDSFSLDFLKDVFMFVFD
jgi:hypothetical protein